MQNNWKLFDDRFKNRRDTNAPGWSSEESYQKHEAELERILDSGYVPKKGRMLELGSGAGNNCIFMAKQGWEVYGVDISPAAIAWAKERAEKEGGAAVFRAGDVAELKEEKMIFLILFMTAGFPIISAATEESSSSPVSAGC